VKIIKHKKITLFQAKKLLIHRFVKYVLCWADNKTLQGNKTASWSNVNEIFWKISSEFCLRGKSFILLFRGLDTLNGFCSKFSRFRKLFWVVSKSVLNFKNLRFFWVVSKSVQNFQKKKTSKFNSASVHSSPQNFQHQQIFLFLLLQKIFTPCYFPLFNASKWKKGKQKKSFVRVFSSIDLILMPEREEKVFFMTEKK
jgi:hypothetical protein